MGIKTPCESDYVSRCKCRQNMVRLTLWLDLSEMELKKFQVQFVWLVRTLRTVHFLVPGAVGRGVLRWDTVARAWAQHECTTWTGMWGGHLWPKQPKKVRKVTVMFCAGLHRRAAGALRRRSSLATAECRKTWPSLRLHRSPPWFSRSITDTDHMLNHLTNSIVNY